MTPILAAYIPSLPGAGLALAIQIVLFGVLAGALFLFSRQRFHPKRVIIALTIGAAVGWLGGLAFQASQLAWGAQSASEVWGALTDWLLIAYIELHWCLLPTFFGILASWLSLETVGPFLLQRRHAAQNQDKS